MNGTKKVFWKGTKMMKKGDMLGLPNEVFWKLTKRKNEIRELGLCVVWLTDRNQVS